MANDLGPERGVHGRTWGRIHGGYFSDPDIAKPLIEAIRSAWGKARPDVVVDLGGGPGFFLSQLRAGGIGGETALVNLDCSTAQIEEAGAAGVSSVCGSVDGFRREEVVPAGRTALWVMRSVLHYAGADGLTPLLRHLRAQAAEGEIWIHQTGCFVREAEAACLNALYRRMRTAKWYPTVADLRGRLATAGWRVETVRPAPTLHLDSKELGVRYRLEDAEIGRIGAEMATEFGAQNDVFRLLPTGFSAELRYGIFVCRAAP